MDMTITEQQLDKFKRILSDYRKLPTTFVRDIIMKSPSEDIMNGISRGILTLYSYDDAPNDLSLPNVMRQSMELISLLPLITVYSYHAKNYYIDGGSFFIHQPVAEYSTAENILHMLRPDCSFTELEASILDLALVLHAEHGGGNNSTFTTHVVTSSGTDTYSAISAALASLKGPKHGGANIKVSMMFDDMKNHISDWEDEDEIKNYLIKLLHKEGFDRSGLIYGMGHAVYSISDPRANLLRQAVEKLSKAKGREKEFKLYNSIERLAPQVIADERKIYKGVSANVDFYSGFAYTMLDLPRELYTPLFAIARISGWSAHRMEELVRLFAEEGMTVEDYLDNVLAEHFTQFGNEIEASLARNTKRNPRHEHDKPATKAAKGKRNTTDSERALATFLESSEIKTRQCVYIDRETHRQIAHITRFLGEGLSIGKFVDNILRDHFWQYGTQYMEQIENAQKVKL